ncbi:MAG: MFS transporter [Acidobacteriota bacterium]
MTSTPSARQRFAVIAALYISQAIPVGFHTVAVPTILRDYGMSLTAIGVSKLIAVPWLLKFLWAPLIDAFGSRRLGHFRSWILPLQTLSVVIVSTLALMALDVSPGLALALGALYMVLAATQDIAVDGLAIRILRTEERGPGNGIQVGGYYLGQVIGGGLLLVVYSRFGWTMALALAAALLALALFPIVRFPEEAAARSAPPSRNLDFAAIARFFRRANLGGWIVIILLYRVGESITVVMLSPMLIDLDWSPARIGLVLGIGNAFAALAGALLGGLLVARRGRRIVLASALALQAVPIALLILGTPGLLLIPGWAIVAIVLVVSFFGGLGAASLYTNMMDASDSDTPATDFTLQQSIFAFGPIFATVVAGPLAEATGYGMVFALAAASCVVAALVASKITLPAEVHQSTTGK